MTYSTNLSKKLLAGLMFLVIFNIFLKAQVTEVYIEYERLSEKVLVVWGGKIYKDQVVAIATEKGIVLIDAGKAPTLTAEYKKIIERELGRNDFAYVINTHYHFDHSSGNQVFPEAKIIAHQKSPVLMEQWAAGRQNFVNVRRTNQMIQWANQLKTAEPETEQWIRLNDYLTTGNVMLDDYENNYVLSLPDITFNDKMSLNLGDVTLDLYYFGEGMHTGDDILVCCAEEKLVFSGDLFFKGSFGFARRPNFEGERWISVLSEIFDGNQINWVYDNHNGKMSGEFVKLYKNYMKDVWESLSQAKEEGMDFETVKEKYSYENRFAYINKSGLDTNVLKRDHEANLKFTWYCVNKSESAAAVIGEVINTSGIEAALNKYRQIEDMPEIKYFFDEAEFNTLGYRLMSGGKIPEAIEIFKINVEKNPSSGNVYDSLGEAYMNAGKNELAIESYKKSLELNPTNTNAVERLKILGVE